MLNASIFMCTVSLSKFKNVRHWFSYLIGYFSYLTLFFLPHWSLFLFLNIENLLKLCPSSLSSSFIFTFLVISSRVITLYIIYMLIVSRFLRTPNLYLWSWPLLLTPALIHLTTYSTSLCPCLIGHLKSAFFKMQFLISPHSQPYFFCLFKLSWPQICPLVTQARKLGIIYYSSLSLLPHTVC